MNKKSSLGYIQILLSIWCLGIVIILWRCLSLCDGHLIYNLDDPYIHLSVAENILHGSYGVNAGEYSAPCSSIIYPFILAVTEWIKLGSVGPLIVNLLAMGGAVYILGKIIKKHIFPSVDEVNKFSINYIFYLALGVLLCLVMNAWGLVFTGMEHSIHILLCLVVFYGFLQVVEINKKPPAFLYIALILLPLIRFEGLALSIFGIILLYYFGHRKYASLSLILVALLMAVWAYFMHLHSLPFFPSSVQLKSQIVSSVGTNTIYKFFYLIAKNFWCSLHLKEAQVFCLSLIILSFVVYKNFKNKKFEACFGLIILLAAVSHAILGRYGWFARYEIYAVILTWLTIVFFSKKFIDNIYFRLILILVLIKVAVGHSTFKTPENIAEASRNIYEQQYQMHRFAFNFWRRPVAVNDLGCISYQNSFYVLDLYGLGSEEVRLSKKLGTFNANKINNLIIHKNISLIMIYDKWFEGIIPKNWEKIGTLKTSKVTAGDDSVEFYLPVNSDIVTAKNYL